jgi:sigma-E factor negative regulatory protein RseA
MKAELSALIDGETEEHEAAAVLAALKANPAMRDAWAEYLLIGDVLRDEPELDRDITSGVMQRLAEEPVVLAPQPRRQSGWQRPLAALAASVAGVAVVGWLALTPARSPEQTLAVASTGPVGQPVETVAASDMQEYLLAHQANAPGLRLQGGSQNIRPVSVLEAGR